MARILLVDDDIAEISAVKRVLLRAGHQAVLATNASDALAVFSQVTPALALVAAACEGGEALALAHRLAAGDGGPPVPLILLGHADGIPEGAAQLARPVDPGQLAEEVTAALARAISAAPAPASTPAKNTVRENGPATVRRTAGAVQPERSVSAPAETRSRGTTPTPTPTPTSTSTPSSISTATATARPAATGAPVAGHPERGAAAGGAESRDARRAAAEALRARADELRRAAPPAATEEDDGLEALLRRAEEAERRHLAERKARVRQSDRATVEAAQRAEAERIVVEKAARAREAEARADVEERARADAEALRREEEARRAEAEARAAAEAARRTEAEGRARRDAEAARRAAAEATRRAELEKRAAAEAARRAEAERRDAEDAARRAEEERREAEEAARRAEAERREAEEAARRAEAERSEAEDAARRADAERREAEERARREARDEADRARDAEEKAASEADARRRLEAELERLRVQLEEERRAAEERIQSVLERAAAEEQAAEELRRIADEEARREVEETERRRREEEEDLRRAIESARTEMEGLRRRTDEEARRREEAEAELRRISEEAAREPVAFPFPDDAPRPAPAEASEDAARRRVAALRGRELDEAPATPSAATWLAEPSAPTEPAATAGAPPPELRSGTLADLPAPRLLALAARAKVSGRIDVQGETARSLYLEDGRVVGATSGDPADRVEELALRFGLLTRDQHRQLAAAAASLPSRRAALLLLERGFLKPTELTGLVRRRAEEVVFGLFSEPAARFRWAGATVPPDERIALERAPLALAIEGVRRRWLAARVDEVLGGPGTLLVPAEGGPALGDLGLSAEERRAVTLADGLRTLDEIVAASPLDALSTRQVLAALVLVDALRVRLLQGGRPAAAATAAIDLARVREKLDQARRADYFTILGIGRLCTPHEARAAAERLCAEFAPSRFIGLREDGLPAALDEILRVVADARDVLADDRLRAEYLGGLGD